MKMGYYKDKKQAFIRLHSMVTNAKSEKKTIKISSLLIEFEKQYIISRKLLLAKLNDYVDAGEFVIDGDDLIPK